MVYPIFRHTHIILSQIFAIYLQYIPIFFAEPAFKELGFRALAPLRSASVGAGPSSRGGSNFTWRKNVEKYDETYHDMAVCQNLVPL